MSGLRTLTLSLLQILKPVNRVAQLEFFQDNFLELLRWLRKIKFL